MGLSERVLVVPAAEFDRLGRFQGFSGDADRYLNALLIPELASFRPRSEVEDDPSFKQIIPYVIFRSNGLVFTYVRGKRGGELRLRRLRSLGVGGHVAEADAEVAQAFVDRPLKHGVAVRHGEAGKAPVLAQPSASHRTRPSARARRRWRRPR